MSAGEQVFVLDDVAILGALQLLGQPLGRFAGQLAVQPLHEHLPLRFAGVLVGFFGRHLTKVHNLFHQGVEFLLIDWINRLKRIQPNISLLLVRPVAGDAVSLHHLQRPVMEFGGIDFSLP